MRHSKFKIEATVKPEAAVKMINSWMKKATDNLIESIISTSDINADTDLVLANAVYFKGAWLEPFNPYRTMRGTFHRLDGDHAEAEFMRSGLTWLDVACMDGFKVLKLPYKRGAAPPARAVESGGGQPAGSGQLKRRRGQVAAKSKATPPTTEVNEGTQYSMFFFLPDARDGLSTMVDIVTASPSFLYGILAEMKERPVMLELPKFAITFSWGDLKADLRRLGLSLPFSPEAADLRGMCKGDDGDEVVAGAARRPTFLSKVAHTAVVKVNEVGTEAAAVTVHLCGGGGPPPDLVEFTVDHPFTFFIMEERSGVIVFAGHVLDPTK
jgi:serpin B